MGTFHCTSNAFIILLIIEMRLCCENPQMTSHTLRFHLFGNAMQHQRFEDDDLVNTNPASQLQHCYANSENCCSVEAENIYLAYKFADDIRAISKIGFIRSKLDSFFSIFIKPFIQSLEVYLSDTFASGMQSHLPPHQIATSVSKLYSSILSMVSMPDKINYLQTSKKNILLELKLITATHLIDLHPGLQHCLSTDTEVLHLLGIINPNSTDLSSFEIQDNYENNLVKYLDHFSFFIELLSTFEQEKLTESCASAFEKLFFCRMCQSFNESIISEQNYSQDIPQVVILMGSPCPQRCLNVVRGCYASLTSILPHLSQLSKDFIDLSSILAQLTSRSATNNGGAFLHNHLLDEMRAWSKRLEKWTPKQWKAINEKDLMIFCADP
ncbi:unnamed protein product [Hymenolepis diminuta]|uniref:Uncharacterized protein n=1 Tax=Hymenolepis diminuta TaxID=6216 RepID=A0A564Z4J9_HYMDI|nr:unnamed protein product [Hymenolepis diminuta]